jgi:hypothetical protein
MPCRTFRGTAVGDSNVVQQGSCDTQSRIAIITILPWTDHVSTIHRHIIDSLFFMRKVSDINADDRLFDDCQKCVASQSLPWLPWHWILFCMLLCSVVLYCVDSTSICMESIWNQTVC